MQKLSDHKIFALIMAQALILSLPVSSTESNKGAEKRIIEYLKANIKPGEPVIITKLYNEVFTSSDERRVLDRLYNTFFKVPAYVAQYYITSQRPPRLQELARQFNLSVEGEVDVILRIIEYDQRIPRFMTRDPQTGEIASVDIEKIKGDPRFNKVIERSIFGWEGKPAPSFTVQSLDGKEINLSDSKGKIRLVYFWFSHCPPCMQITPHLVSLQEKFKGRNLIVIGLNADRLLELDYTDLERKAYLDERKVNFPVGHLTAEVQAAYGGVQLFPTIFLVDKEGVIRRHFVNYQDEATLEAAIKSVP